jgi:hypothetical protein
MDASSLETQATLAVGVSYLLQWLKGRPWFPLLNYNSESMNRWITGFAALLTSIGIQVSFNAGAGVLTITGLTAAGIGAGLQHVGFQWALQHSVYKMMIAPALPGAVQATERAKPDAKIIEPMVSAKANAEGPAKDSVTK